MDAGGLVAIMLGVITFVAIAGSAAAIVYVIFRKNARAKKDFERSLKMVQMRIQLPPSSDDKESGSRDARDVADETISRAQTMYNVIANTATRGFYSRIYGQRHIAFEIVASGGLIHYYVSVPLVLVDNIKQAVLASYPNARLEEVEEINLFSRSGKISGTIGGEFVLTKPYDFPILTYKDAKNDAMGAILNALTTAGEGDGVGVQILLRPAANNWTRSIEQRVRNIRYGKKGASGGGSFDLGYFSQILESLWKPPESGGEKQEAKQLTGSEQAAIEAMEEKARHAGYEVLIRLVVSTPNSSRSQALLTGVQSAFALFNSPTGNALRFTPARDIEEFVTSYIMRFFPADMSSNILNTVELASIFHLPDQTNIPSSKVERQMTREIDGPHQQMDPNGLLLGYNVFRGVKKEIRLSQNDRRRHVYVMGSTGMGKSVFLKNMALQDMRAGRGFAFLDPHGDAAEELLKMVPENRIDDVVYFDPSDMENPIGMNLFEIAPDHPDKERAQDTVINEVVGMLKSLYDPNDQGIVGPRMTNIVRNAALLIMSDPEGGTFMDIPKVLVDPEYVKSKIKYLTNQRAIDFWTKEWPNAQRSSDAGEVTSWVVSKWSDFESSMMMNIMGQNKSRLNMREIMDSNKILLVNLSKGRMGNLPARLLGMVFVMKFQEAAMSRANIPEEERSDFCLYVDEFQNFATDSFESILSEARKYHLNLFVANQFMSQLIDKIKGAITGNAGTFIIGRCGTDDVDEIVKLFQPTYQPNDLLFMPNYMAATKLLIDGFPSQPFTIKLPPPMGHPSDELGNYLRAISAQRYGRPRAEVEAEIRKRLGTGASGAAKAHDAPMPVRTSEAPVQKKSFVDNWLAKRKGAAAVTSTSTPVAAAGQQAVAAPQQFTTAPTRTAQQSAPRFTVMPSTQPVATAPANQPTRSIDTTVQASPQFTAMPAAPAVNSMPATNQPIEAVVVPEAPVIDAGHLGAGNVNAQPTVAAPPVQTSNPAQAPMAPSASENNGNGQLSATNNQADGYSPDDEHSYSFH